MVGEKACERAEEEAACEPDREQRRDLAHAKAVRLVQLVARGAGAGERQRRRDRGGGIKRNIEEGEVVWVQYSVMCMDGMGEYFGGVVVWSCGRVSVVEECDMRCIAHELPQVHTTTLCHSDKLVFLLRNWPMRSGLCCLALPALFADYTQRTIHCLWLLPGM